MSLNTAQVLSKREFIELSLPSPAWHSQNPIESSHSISIKHFSLNISFKLLSIVSFILKFSSISFHFEAARCSGLCLPGILPIRPGAQAAPSAFLTTGQRHLLLYQLGGAHRPGILVDCSGTIYFSHAPCR